MLGRADVLSIVCDVYCIFVTFPRGILGRMWYLIVSFPDLCCLSYLKYHYVRGSASINQRKKANVYLDETTQNMKVIIVYAIWPMKLSLVCGMALNNGY